MPNILRIAVAAHMSTAPAVAVEHPPSLQEEEKVSSRIDLAEVRPT